MITQRKTTKASRRRNRTSTRHEIKTQLCCDWLLPRIVSVTFPSRDRYDVAGGLGTDRADIGLWKEPPHYSLANLRAWPQHNELPDPDAVKMFTSQYGVLRGLMIDEMLEMQRAQAIIHGEDPDEIVINVPNNPPKPRFLFHSFTFTEAQALLREAWVQNEESADSIKEIETQAMLGGLLPRDAGFEFQPSARVGGSELRVNNLWSLICFLFLDDYAAKRTAKCASPDCPAPYFLKKRHDQKFCEAGPCVAWGHRQRSLRYWHKKHGKPIRSKQR